MGFNSGFKGLIQSVYSIAIWSKYITLFHLHNKQMLNYAGCIWQICIIMFLRHYILFCYLPRTDTDFSDTILLPIFDHPVLIGGINTERENRCLFTIAIYTECHFYHVLVISEKKKVIVSFLRRASCNNCCARQFVKCRQQVFLMAHPLLCIRSPAAGAIDFFDGRSIVEKAWW